MGKIGDQIKCSGSIMHWFLLIIFTILTGCSGQKITPYSQKLSDLEKVALSQMSNEKRAYLMDRMSNEYIEVNFSYALDSYNRSFSQCKKTENQIANTALGISAGIVGGTLINKVTRGK